ncbi:hypothetical protein LS72_009475 [Helicobacter apodemus]|uniref:Uncharacterized protein n=1 Tax=Helicobacter apodemus TaxID=135569 RepID=A0A4U8UCU8_9HELI|nr:hypothetical protein [Helicobacter apodemus]TLE13766.1 hypothetical protein LS72_009475 [Helicobacter apodemus]
MGYRPHHILDYQVKIGREVGSKDIEYTLTFDEVTNTLEEAKIHYHIQEDEHIINYESLMDFNTNAIYPITPKSIAIINDLQEVASKCDYAKREGEYRIWWF